MSYAPATDFIALLRQTAGGVRTERMPGLDYIVAGLSRASMFLLWVGATAPTTSQTTTVWLKPAAPSWASESTVFLWNGVTAQYEPATPALWVALFGTAAYAFQSVAAAAGAVASTTTLLAIQRAAPAATALTLPAVASRFGRPLQIVDWSTAVVGHAISLTPNGAETVMRLPVFSLLSTVDQLAGVTLYPSTDLNGWVIAP